MPGPGLGPGAHGGHVSHALRKKLAQQGSPPLGILTTLSFRFIWISLFDDLLTAFFQYTF